MPITPIQRYILRRMKEGWVLRTKHATSETSLDDGNFYRSVTNRSLVALVNRGLVASGTSGDYFQYWQLTKKGRDVA